MFVELLQRLQPIRDLPVWARWSFTAVIVLVFFGIRLAASKVLAGYPLLLFFPPIILAMAIAAALGIGTVNTCIAMLVVWWPKFARLARRRQIGRPDRQARRDLGQRHDAQ